MEFIDIRSDTVTHPTQKMREQCLTAQIGDHSYGEDANTLKLEELAAQIMGKQAASFVPSGCFGNQCVVLAASIPMGEMLLPDKSHIMDYEQGSAASLARVMTRVVPTDSKIFMTVNQVQKLIRKEKDYQAPRTFMLQIQNPTKIGSVYPLEHFRALQQIGKRQGLHVHMDGARIFNACQFLNIEAKELAQGCDTVMFCLSKGLCCPIGSMVVGSKQFIKKFNVYKKMLGGYMRKPGIFAAMGIIALKQMTQFLKDDHRITKLLFKELSAISWLKILYQPQTNMIFFKIIDSKLQEREKSLEEYLLEKKKIKSEISTSTKAENRIVVHHYIREQQVETIIQGFNQYYSENTGKN